MRKLLLISFLTGLASSQLCNTIPFIACANNLAESVGMNNTVAQNLFKDYTLMYDWFLYQWGLNPGNTTGMLRVCNGLEQFNACMTKNKACLDIRNLLKSTDINNAFFIDGTLTMYTFNCGPGINTLVHEGLFCAQRVLHNYQNTLKTCVSTYKSSITHDSPNACLYVKNLMNCWSAPFQTATVCQRQHAADVWWACEANKVFTFNQFPNCGFSCDDVATPFANDYLDKHYKMEGNTHWYKIPNYKDLVSGEITTVEGMWMKD